MEMGEGKGRDKLSRSKAVALKSWHKSSHLVGHYLQIRYNAEEKEGLKVIFMKEGQ